MDLAFKQYPIHTSWKSKLGFKIHQKRSLKRADKVIAISEFTKSEIIKYYNWINPKKIIVNYCGYDPKNMLVDLSLNDQLIHEIYNIKSKFILALSSLVSRKNTITILKAYKELLNSNNNYKLVLVGKKDNDTDLLSTYIKENNLVDKIIFTGYVPNNHIGWFYNNCEVYVSASLYEGFGIPNIEAYGVSKRVILSDIPVYREIFGDLVFYFKPLDYIGLCNLLKESNSKRKDSKFLQKFKWENISQKTYEILKI
jgi:glycosyltransferase involved in cell wall biosynthesis